jgi:hypothetical protein
MPLMFESGGKRTLALREPLCLMRKDLKPGYTEPYQRLG